MTGRSYLLCGSKGIDFGQYNYILEITSSPSKFLCSHIDGLQSCVKTRILYVYGCGDNIAIKGLLINIPERFY